MSAEQPKHDTLAAAPAETRPQDDTAQKALHAALAAAQGQFPPIPRDRTVQVRMKTGGTYTFSYAPLDTILAAVRPALSENGLALTQAMTTTDQGVGLRTSLLHAGGGKIEDTWPLLRAEGLDPQQLGSLVTYLRRYTITAMLGIASEEDDDGNSAQGNTATKVDKKPKPAADPKPAAPRPLNERKQADIRAVAKRLEDAGAVSAEQFAHVLTMEYQASALGNLTADQGEALLERLRKKEKELPPPS